MYNFRIAQITKQHIFQRDSDKKYSVIGLFFDEISQNRYNEIYLNYAGGLGTFIYTTGDYFFRIDGAFASVKEKTYEGSFSQTQTDDILVTLGKNIGVSTNADLTPSILFGIPTHQVYALYKPSLGFGQWGVGVQIDSAYKYSKKSSLIGGARYVNFIKRSARSSDDYRFIFSPGNLIDLLAAHKTIIGKHGIEVGYTPRFAFGGTICPYLADAVEKNNYIRSTWYAVYQYRFTTQHTSNRFLLNIAAGFDHLPKKFGNKFIVFCWAAWDLKF